jgi:hypothetical protein
LQAYVANVSPISDISCRSASCCNILTGARSEHMWRRSPRAQRSPRARQAKSVWVLLTCMHISRHGRAALCAPTCWGGHVGTAGACDMRGNSAAVLHAGQALSSCGSGGQAWASKRLGTSHAAQLLQRGDPCLPARTHPTKRPHPLLR